MAESRTAHECALLEAVKGGFIDKVEKLLDSKLINLNDGKYFDYQLIMTALDSHHVELAKILIEKGFRVYKESKANQERTVLHAATAIESKDKDLIRILLAKGASLDILFYDEQNMTPVHIAIDKYRLHTINLFASYYDAGSLDKHHFLHYAILHGKTEVALQFIKKGLSIKKRNKENLTPFWIAIKNINFDILNILLSKCSLKDINSNNSDDLAPVYAASFCNNLEFIQNYAKCGLPINNPLKLCSETWPSLNEFSGFTVMHFAVKHVRLDVVKLLLKLGADILIKNENGSTPLHIAFENREKDIGGSQQDNNLIIDWILDVNIKFNLNPINNHGLSHFHIACSRDKTTVIEHFLKLDVCIDQQVNYLLYEDFSPLHFATKFECLEAMELLLKNRANVKLTNSKKMTALHIAVEGCSDDAVSLLLQYDADIACKDAHGNTPVHWAFKNSEYGTVDLLLSAPNAANSNPRNSEGVSHFHIACTRRNAKVVKSFIDNGVHLDSCVPANRDYHGCFSDYSGFSPLHIAARNERAKIILLLLHNGVNINIKNNHGETPIELAYQDTLGILGGRLNEIQYDRNTVFHSLALRPLLWYEINSLIPTLTNIGFNINSQDSEGLTALHVACKNKNYYALEVLLMLWADISIEDNKGSSVCCYLYEEYLKNMSRGINLGNDVQQMIHILQKQIIKMTVIGLPVSEKVFMSNSKFNRFRPLTDQKKIKLTSQCQLEMQILKDTNIHEDCKLYDVIFKDENALAHIVNNPAFEDIVFSQSLEEKCPNYSYLIDSKFLAGVNRANLLPTAKSVLNDLAGLHLPDICSENICKYFTNAELKVSTEILRGVLDLKMENSDNNQLTECRTDKRQKVN